MRSIEELCDYYFNKVDGFRYLTPCEIVRYDPGSYYYLEKKEKINKIVKLIKDDYMLDYAKSGLLMYHIDELKKVHPVTAALYMTINNIVREAYYAYVVNQEESWMANDKRSLIFVYKDVISDDFSKALSNKTIVWDEIKNRISFLDYAKQNQMGIKIVDFDCSLGMYASYSFSLYLAAIRVLTTDNKQLIMDARDVINEEINKIQSLSIEEYRQYKLDLMGISDEEKEKYDQKVSEYNYAYRKNNLAYRKSLNNGGLML